MIHEPSALAVVVFAIFVAITLGLSFYLGAKTRSAKGYFAAGGGIPWFVNGIAFAGDYLSAASFLGICGMIAFYGYDGFLYSIGYLAGWIVALFVIAEPLKRMGKYTFADALDSRFNSRGIKLAAATSTLAVSIFYLIPQMVGAGVLIKPLLGFPHWVGVMLVGSVVVVIVVTAGMVSTTWVQFIKGSLLVIFSTVLTVMILNRGLETSSPPTLLDAQFHALDTSATADQADWHVLPDEGPWSRPKYIRARFRDTDRIVVARETAKDSGQYVPTQTFTLRADGAKLIDGLEQESTFEGRVVDLEPVGHVAALPNSFVAPPSGGSSSQELRTHQPPEGGTTNSTTGPLGPLEFLATVQQSTIVLTGIETVKESDGSMTTIYYPKPTHGSEVLRPGNHPSLKGIRSEKLADKLNFLSLMLALFAGTASLPHILIRYYTVKDQAAARKSTIVGIASIGFFYVLTLYMGLGAMTSGALDPTNDNMAAPLLAKSLSPLLFAVISAIAFTTVLGTVSGLIIAASGAVAHDLMDTFFKLDMTDHVKVRIAKLTAVVVGLIAIALGILFEGMNVSYLVGWAFSVAASANLPSLVMLLFWKGTTRQGITAAITVGMISSLGWILASADTYEKIYGLPAADALVPFSQPGIVTIPLGFAVLVAVSLLTRRRNVQG